MAIPIPRPPSASWSRFREKIRRIFHGASPRVCIAFWLFGLINNVLYVIILSAALDLVGPDIPKGVVLISTITPSFVTKLCCPYFIHTVPYHLRIFIFVILSGCGMLIIALAPGATSGGTIGMRMFGVMFASISSGAGELTFLGLTHFYGPFSLAAWSSGTGGAGLFGAGVYALATTTLGVSVRATLLASAVLPAVMVVSFFMILPREPLKLSTSKPADGFRIVSSTDHDEDDENDLDSAGREDERLLGSGLGASTAVHSTRMKTNSGSAWAQFVANLKRSKGLFFPFMLPLILVYVAEYSINQGVSPTLLFPLSQTPFKQYRAFYPTYNAIYQVGVFISRSSSPFVRVHHLYLPSILQVINLILLIAHSLFNIIPSVYIIFAIILWEGLLGGLVYVSTFAEIAERVPKAEREFSLGATTVSDSGGIFIAGFLSMTLEVSLCNYQVSHGRKVCKQI